MKYYSDCPFCSIPLAQGKVDKSIYYCYNNSCKILFRQAININEDKINYISCIILNLNMKIAFNLISNHVRIYNYSSGNFVDGFNIDAELDFSSAETLVSQIKMYMVFK